MTQSEMEPATFLLVARCLNQLRHRIAAKPCPYVMFRHRPAVESILGIAYLVKHEVKGLGF